LKEWTNADKFAGIDFKGLDTGGRE